MNKEKQKIRIDILRKELREHNKRYYVENLPTISDKEFDFLMKELEQLEKENPDFFDANSPTQRVGNDINSNFVQVKHKYPMLSLGNTYSAEELIDFDNRIKKLIEGDFKYVCELKFDGASISLHYKNGEFIKGHLGKMLRHPFSGSSLAYKMGLPSEVCHIIAVHAREGEKNRFLPEAIIVNHADFINFHSLKL